MSHTILTNLLCSSFVLVHHAGSYWGLLEEKRDEEGLLPPIRRPASGPGERRDIRRWRPLHEVVEGEGPRLQRFHEQFSSFMHPDDYVVIGCASRESTNHVSLPPLELETDRYKMSIALDGFFFHRGDNHNEEVVNVQDRGKLGQ